MKNINLVLTFTFFSVLLSGCGMTGPLYKETAVGKAERIVKEAQRDLKRAERDLDNVKRDERLEREEREAAIIKDNQMACENGDETACLIEETRLNHIKCEEGDEAACQIEEMKIEMAKCAAIEAAGEECQPELSEDKIEEGSIKEDTKKETKEGSQESDNKK